MSNTDTPAETPPQRQDAPFDTRDFRRALGRFATGVTVVTCLDAAGHPVGVTANSFSSVSLDPPLVSWSISNTAHSIEAFRNAAHFAFSVLALDQVELSNRFARQGADKFGGLAWRAGEGGVPLVPDCAAYIECRQHAAFPGGDHLILVGEVVRHTRADRVPLVFADGRYSALAPHPGTEAPALDAAPDERHPYDDFLLPLLFRAYTHLYRNFAETLVKERATGAQMRVLSVLASRGASRPPTLLTRSLLSQSSLDEACESLRAGGFVASDAEGRLAITAAGRAKLTDLLTIAAERERHSTEGLDPAETHLLHTLLRKLVRQHEPDNDPAETADPS